MKKNSRTIMVLALVAFVASLGLTACQKSDAPPGTPGTSTNAAPEKKPDHSEHPKK